jgi:hypothetical protein
MTGDQASALDVVIGFFEGDAPGDEVSSPDANSRDYLGRVSASARDC